MSDYDTTAVEGTDLEPRDARALTDYLLVYEEAPGLFTVAGESGATYTVDADTGACTCPDAEHRSPEGGCKHVRRVAFHTGESAVPSWVDRDAMDPLLVEQLADVEASAKAVATDGGMLVADDDAELLDESDGEAYTDHVEPRAQGGRRYVRCTDCGRELLCSLGGRDALPHAEGCSHQ